MANDILSEFDASDINNFNRDFTQMVKVGMEIDRYFTESQQHDLGEFIKKFSKLAAQFNKKYNGMKIRTKKDIGAFKMALLVNAKGIKEFFAESASRISGLKSIGGGDFNQIDAGDPENLRKFTDSLKEKVFLTYADPQSGSGTVIAIWDKNEEMVELAYSPEDIFNSNSATFRLCAFYALKGGYDKKIDIYEEACTFGFSNLLDEAEKREWQDKFNPGFLE